MLQSGDPVNDENANGMELGETNDSRRQSELPPDDQWSNVIAAPGTGELGIIVHDG